jgi:hypothetical protein
MSHLSEEQLILYYYGEEQGESVAEEHLSACDSCRTDFEELKRVLAAVNALGVPERAADYSSEVWKRLQPRLRGGHRFPWLGVVRPQKLAWVGMITGLLVVAFLAGRYWLPAPSQTARQQGPTAAAPSEIRERILVASIADHLERSQMILLDLINIPDNRRIDIAADRTWARELLAENRIYRQSALENGKAGIASLLDDLERILVEIANSPVEISRGELTDLRRRIDAQGLIFKLRIVGANMKRNQDKAARELARSTS